jgi:HB1, ASXL, restriction endonuclease HTH domain
MNEDLRDTVLSAIEESLDAQLRAVRRLRKGEASEAKPSRRARLSQVDMAYDILKKARNPLHVVDLIERIQSAFGVVIDRESLVSSLSKKIAREDRFLRTEPNTFGLRPEAR